MCLSDLSLDTLAQHDIILAAGDQGILIEDWMYSGTASCLSKATGTIQQSTLILFCTLALGPLATIIWNFCGSVAGPNHRTFIALLIEIEMSQFFSGKLCFGLSTIT